MIKKFGCRYPNLHFLKVGSIANRLPPVGKFAVLGVLQHFFSIAMIERREDQIDNETLLQISCKKTK